MTGREWLLPLKLLLAVLAFVFWGWPTVGFLFRTRQQCPAWERLALAYGMGVAWLTVEMLVVSMLGVRLALPVLLAPALPLTLTFGWWAWRNGVVVVDWMGLVQTPTRILRHLRSVGRSVRVLTLALLGLIALQLTFVMARALIFPPHDYDTYAHWGFRASIFFHAQRVVLPPGIAYPEYPLLVPLAETWTYLNLGHVDDTLVQVLFLVFGVSLLTIFYYELRRQRFSPICALFFTSVLVTAGNEWTYHFSIAYADLAVGFYYGVGTILMYQCISLCPPKIHRYLLASGLFLGAAVWTKSEALPMVLINCAVLSGHWTLNRKLAVLDVLSRLSFCLAPILVFFVPWLVFRQLNTYPLLSQHLGHLRPDRLSTILTSMLGELLNYRREGILWGLVLVTTLLTLRRSLTRPLAYLLVITVLQTALTIVMYAAAPFDDLPSHIGATFHRLLIHIIPVTAFLVALQIGHPAFWPHLGALNPPVTSRYDTQG